MPKLTEINIVTSIPIILILFFLVYNHITQDFNNSYYIKSSICHKELSLKKVKLEDRLAIEEVVDTYLQRKEKNMSKSSNVLYEIRNGALRGVLGAIVLGGGISEITAGAIVYGTISGFSKAYTQCYTTDNRLDPMKA
jgi:Na+/melibiose symporter-like transporter